MKLARLAFIACILLGGYVHAGPIAIAKAGAVTITLYDEPCALPAVANLKQRATWAEPGKTYNGCWGASELGVVMLYFEDLTVAAVPMQVFVRVTQS